MEPRELSMYQDVLRVRKTIHHVSRIPLPFPMTVLGFFAGVVVGLVMLLVVDVHPFFHASIPLGVSAFITYHEPDGINGFQFCWAQVRMWFRRSRRVGNRAVTIPNKRFNQSHQVTRFEWKGGAMK